MVRWGLFLLVMCGSISVQAQKSVLLDKVVAVVDDDIIMKSELDNRTRAIGRRLQQQGTSAPPTEVLELRVLNQLVLESIQLQRAAIRGIRIADDLLNKTIANIASSNNMTLEQFEAQLALEGETYASAREQIRREMLVTRLQQSAVDRRVRVTELEVENFLASKEGRTQSGAEYLLGHILIALPESASEDEIANVTARAEGILAQLQAGAEFRKVAVAESDGRQALEGGVIGWRKENELPTIAADILPTLAVGEPSKLLRTGSGFHIITPLEKRGGTQKIVDQYRVRHILIAPSEIRTDEQAKEISEKLYERLLNDEDFATLAKANSDDPVSAIDGGDLDWVNTGQMVPQFEEVMLVSPVGKITQPFKSDFGWHILQVTDVRKQDVGAKLQENQARQVIRRRKYEEELLDWLQEIKSESFIEVKEERFAELENK